MTDYSDIGKYYDRNTSRFLPTKERLKQGAIHRQLYGPGVKTHLEAAAYANQLVLKEIQSHWAQRILDLGCGVGGTIRYLQDKWRAHYTGITLSQEQVKAGAAFGTKLEEADFLNTQWFEKKEPYDLIYAIESLQHNPDHNKLAQNLGMVTRTGTSLAVIDDFLYDNTNQEDPLIHRFRRHWHAYGYTSLQGFIGAMKTGGFRLEKKVDLTSLMSRDYFKTTLTTITSLVLRGLSLKGEYVDNIIGGNALKQLQYQNKSGYFLLVFERTA